MLDLIKKKIILGTRSLSGDMGEVNKKNISKTIEYAIEKNFIYYDTAPVYGNGEIDKVLSIYKKEIIVNTKCGYNSSNTKKTFQLSDIQRTLEKSLQFFEKINIFYLHNPRHEIKDWNKIIYFLKDLKKKKLIKFIGISLARDYYFSKEILNQFDFIQDEFNLLRIIKHDLYNSIKAKIIARSPLASGVLSSNFNINSKFSKKDYRYNWLRGLRKKNILFQVSELKKIIKNNIESYAFSFLLYNKKVTYINYGIKNKEHINFLLDKKSFFKIDDKDIKKIISLSKNNYKLNLNQKGY